MKNMTNQLRNPAVADENKTALHIVKQTGHFSHSHFDKPKRSKED
jgi:hypothetical protein